MWGIIMPDLSFLGPSAAVVIVVIMFLKFLTNVGKVLVEAISGLTKSQERVAKATEKAANEAKQRNGHLAELAIENNKNNAISNKAILDAVANITTQHVDTQNVTQQTIGKSNE